MIEYTEFRRCKTCGRFFEVHEWAKRGQTKCKCGNGWFFPTRLSMFELARYCITHPTVLWETVWAKLTE